MKVILTAFQGKLSSEPVEWPQGQGLSIKLYMDIDRLLSPQTETSVASFGEERVLGIFVATGQYFVLSGGETAEEYKLVEVVSK